MDSCLTFCTLVGCGGLERTPLKHFQLWDGVVILEQYLLWEGVVVLKKTDFYQFLPLAAVVVLKNSFVTVSTVGGCGGVERTHF